MGPVLQFIRPFDVFDTATLTILSEAYDEALVSLHDHGQPIVVRETIALRIYSRDAARRIAANIAKLPELRKP
jgi:hypothetical protein